MVNYEANAVDLQVKSQIEILGVDLILNTQFSLMLALAALDCYEFELGRVAKPLAAKISPLVLTSSEIMMTSS